MTRFYEIVRMDPPRTYSPEDRPYLDVTGPVRQFGPRIPIRVRLHPDQVRALKAEGQLVPNESRKMFALIDTGAPAPVYGIALLKN